MMNIDQMIDKIGEIYVTLEELQAAMQEREQLSPIAEQNWWVAKANLSGCMPSLFGARAALRYHRDKMAGFAVTDWSAPADTREEDA